MSHPNRDRYGYIAAMLVGGSLAFFALFVALGQATPAAPDPVSCTGYPERRVYLENQSWWEPQAGPPSHPGTGKQGHIHIGTCFPLYQSLNVASSSATIHFDLRIQLHNMPGVAGRIFLDAYGDLQHDVQSPNTQQWTCPSADCERWVGVDFPLGRTKYSGWREFNIFMLWNTTDGHYQRNVARYYVYIKNGKPPAPAGSTGSVVDDVGGDSWFVAPGPNGKYAAARIARADIPWQEPTMSPRTLSGVWRPTVEFGQEKGFVFIDPALHAVPLNKGLVVYNATGPRGRRVRISVDTPRLANGPHRMLIGTCNKQPEGQHCGTLVVPILVAN
jgi:hypothetical protein